MLDAFLRGEAGKARRLCSLRSLQNRTVGRERQNAGVSNVPPSKPFTFERHVSSVAGSPT